MPTALPLPAEALILPDEESRLLTLWLHGRSPHTKIWYARAAARFLAFARKPLNHVTLADLQAYSDHLTEDPGLKASSRNRMLAALKSLFTFGNRLGVLPVNVGAALKLPPVRDELATRILEEALVHTILAHEKHPRNYALLLLLYAGGLRAEEAASLRWKDTAESGSSGQVTVFGKGGKTRSILLPERAWKALQALRNGAHPEAPVFVSRKQGQRLTTTQVWRIVRAAARRAGVEEKVSPHWFRHAHASHAIDRGAPISLVQATLGHASVATTGKYLHARPNDSSGRFLAI